MKRITPGQCKKARGLLKWNIRDLAHRTNVPAERITSFEKGMITFYAREVNDVSDCFKREGIVMQEFGEVSLSGNAKDVERAHQTQAILEHGQKTYGVSESELEYLYGTSSGGRMPNEKRRDDDDRHHRYSTD